MPPFKKTILTTKSSYNITFYSLFTLVILYNSLILKTFLEIESYGKICNNCFIKFCENQCTMKTNGKILLTGAGFTHNFGTPLAEEMWAIIFNHESVQSTPRIKNLMLKDFDYESIYYTIMEGSFTDSEKEAINDATLFAYKYLDSIIRDYRFTRDAPYPVTPLSK